MYWAVVPLYPMIPTSVGMKYLSPEDRQSSLPAQTRHLNWYILDSLSSSNHHEHERHHMSPPIAQSALQALPVTSMSF
jgi:hypothetical protein